MNCKKNANSNPGEEKQLFHPESEKVVEIGLERLRPFKNHPFKVKEDEAMAQLMREILFILKLIGRILLIPVWLLLTFIGVCVSAVVNLYCVAKGLAGLLLGAMLVCTFIWYRTRFMNYILLGVAEFMLVGVLAAGAFILALVTEARDGVGRFIIGG